MQSSHLNTGQKVSEKSNVQTSGIWYSDGYCIQIQEQNSTVILRCAHHSDCKTQPSHFVIFLLIIHLNLYILSTMLTYNAAKE